MVDKGKNLNVNLSDPMSNHKDLIFRRCYYISIFCPKCGKFNIRRHRILKRRLLCDNCGYKWKK